MEKRSMFNWMFGNKKTDSQGYSRFELVSNSSNSYYSWDGNIFGSDIVRAAIRPKANAIGKLNAKHIRGTGTDIKIYPDAFIRDILEYPNKYMTMQEFLMKMTYQREIHHNAFAYVKRDINGYVEEIYPVPYSSVELLEKENMLFLKFSFRAGKYMVVPYEDCIHLRKDFNENDFFGESGTAALKNIMDVITTTDQGIVNAVKNSAVVKWIMMFRTTLQPKDKQLAIDDFAKNYLSIDKANGVASSDPRYDLKQVEDKSYVPNAAQIDRAIQRLQSFFGVNDAIVQNKFTEDEWNAFYESEVEPVAIALSKAFTKIFFTKKERGFGNRIIFEASNLQYASMSTKLDLVQMVDRGALKPNEWRAVLNLGPIEGGDVPIRRLDTAKVEDKPKEDDKSAGNQKGTKDDGSQGSGATA